jgi:enamine deaminase RidA (YjgF/YER057c/UK114 family)
MAKHMQPVNPPGLAKPAGYSHAFEAQGGKTLYIAGQVGMDQEGRVVGKGDIVAQFRQVCENLRTIVTAAPAR